MPQTPKVKNLAELMHWIADEYHDGAVLPIADKIRVSPALVGLWSRGQTAEPKTTNLQRLAAAYDLDFIWLLGLVHGRKLLPIRGGSAATALPTVDGPSGPVTATLPPEAKKSMKSRAFPDIMSTKHVMSFLRMATRLHRDYLVGSEALIACAA